MSTEVLEKFKEYRSEVEKQTEKIIKRLRIDEDGEYEKWMKAHFKGSDIIHEMIISYNPNQNKIIKRMNQTIMKRIKMIIRELKLDKRL